VADALRVSALNDGWRVLNSALAVERMQMGGAIPTRGRDAASRPEVRNQAVDLVAVAKATGRSDDPAIRQEIARIHALRRINRWNAERAEGESDMRTATVLKLAMSDILHGSARVHAQLLGTESMLVGPASQAGDDANQTGMWAFINSIGGGSDQIQRNIIAERVLGLPHDPAVDRDVPFRDVRKAEAVRRLSGRDG
jgi:alkylation response protein AidB-like acyl-CoA dehydrogenase